MTSDSQVALQEVADAEAKAVRKAARKAAQQEASDAGAKAARKAARKVAQQEVADAEEKASRKAARKAAQQEVADAEAKTAPKGAPKAAREAEQNAEQEAVIKRWNSAAQPLLGEAKEPKAKKAKHVDDDAGRAYLAAHEITIHEEDAPPPCMTFASAPFPAPLVGLLTSQPGFVEPSAVQAATWPLAVSGRDVLAIAKTGSGKTLGFLLPVLSRCHLEREVADGAPTGLIMAPTRELALQISTEAIKFGKCVRCRAVAVYGGAPKGPQVSAVQRGCELIIGTPGRIKDILDTQGGGRDACTSMERFTMLVLDEADRMLDMGFERDIRAIVWQAFGKRTHQTFLYSATWPAEVQGIAHDLLSDAVKVTVGTGGEKLTANKSVTQRVHVVDDGKRWDTFVQLITPFGKGGSEVGKRVIVFANMKITVNRIAEFCRGEGFAADSLSGDRTQSQRETTIRRFREGIVTVVIATDVAARGLDIKGIERVINYELPADDFQDYVHRIGRTARAGAMGESDSIFTSGDKMYAKELIHILTDAGQKVPQQLANFTPQSKTFDDDSD